MKLDFDLRELVQNTFQYICDQHQLSTIRISDDLAGIRGEDFIIIIGIDIDGIYVNYFNKSEKCGYDLVAFLLDNRRSELTFSKPEQEPETHKEFIFSHLQAVANHLNSGGKDILNGERDWQGKYKRTKVILSEFLENNILL